MAIQNTMSGWPEADAAIQRYEQRAKFKKLILIPEVYLMEPAYQHHIQIGDLITMHEVDPLDPENTWLRVLITGFDTGFDGEMPQGFVVASNYDYWLQPKFRKVFTLKGIYKIPPERMEIVRAA